jgi:hypothetical protein
MADVESLELIETDVMTLLQLCAQIVGAIGKVDGSSRVQSEHALQFLRLLAKIQEDLLAHVHVIAAQGSTLHLDLTPHRVTVDALRARVHSVQQQLLHADAANSHV